jgi:hypothetical protein
MLMSKLCELLGIEERAPVYYDTDIAIRERLQVLFVEKEFQKESIDYVDSEGCYEQGIHIQDIPVNEYVKRERIGNPPNYSYLLNMIQGHIKKYPIKMESLLYASFCLFHEEGHWVDFKQSGLTGKEFMIRDAEFRTPVKKLGFKIIKMDNSDPFKHFLAKEHTEQYRAIPSEKSADLYALNRLTEDFSCIEKIYETQKEDNILFIITFESSMRKMMQDLVNKATTGNYDKKIILEQANNYSKLIDTMLEETNDDETVNKLHSLKVEIKGMIDKPLSNDYLWNK